LVFHVFGYTRHQASNPTFLGTGELGNDDDETTRVTTRGNETVALVRGFLNEPRTRMGSRHPPETATRKCDELEAKLAELKSSAGRILSNGVGQVKEKVSGQRGEHTFYLNTSRPPLTTPHPSQPKTWRSGQKKSDDIVRYKTYGVRDRW